MRSKNQNTRNMKQNYKATKRMLAVLLTAVLTPAAWCAPAAPTALKADVKGTRVDLGWSNGDAGAVILENGFEDEEFPPAGWSTVVTNDYKYLCSWFRFPGDDFIQTGNYTDYLHSGDGSAMMYFDMYAMSGDHDPAQDEWLILPPTNGAAYLELWSYIDPKILEYGLDEEFPDHYIIQVSYDGGNKWEELWDAPRDASPFGGWQLVTLPIRQSDEAVSVAFRGYSESGEMVHFLWGIDDVRLLGPASGDNGDRTEGYTVKINGNTVAEHVKSLQYTDLSPKEAGTYRYEVFAECGGTLSAAAGLDVTIDDIELLPPTDLEITTTQDESDETSYMISLEWKEPEGVMAPVSYSVYCDGLEVGCMLEEPFVEFWGYTKGVYLFEVTAVYENPDGESERTGKRVAIDTRYNAHSLKAEADGTNVRLGWQAPEAGDVKVSHYEVWRGDVKIAGECKETEIEDEAPAGHFRYSVIAVYEDGVRAFPAILDFDNGKGEPRRLTFAENFNTGFLPAGWEIENLWENTPDNELWQFDDPNGLGVTGDGFEGAFASIDCLNSGFYSLDGVLMTPEISVEGCDPATLAVKFNYDYASTGVDSQAVFEVLPEGAADWVRIETLESYNPEETDGEFSPKRASHALADYIGSASVIRLRWRYSGMMDYHLAIDNVEVSDATSGVASAVASGMTACMRDGAIEVYAAGGIDNVRVYTVDGCLESAAEPRGEERISIPAAGTGVRLVRLVGSDGSQRTFRLIL